ncbi:hypothetical protein AV274_5540 [Blastocystis sp. ATCC 50177/Nand II]|uniref:Uncharacterized protein n=1 Tax=Blastocystis sp. subtype 1 (strain ATCC 50177 / NandII) TaxID=478820 RepID=A0A196S6Y4_BLAHN|nr:hypothetical protein AV274_5540 [Blastocystis sp. ATCC 50177/Nand II]
MADVSNTASSIENLLAGIEDVPDDIDFSDEIDKELMEDEDAAVLDAADNYEPYTAESVRLEDTEEASAEWKDRFSQFKKSLGQMQDKKSEISRLKKKMWRMKQKQMGLMSQINVQQNDIKLKEERIESLQNELREANQSRITSEQAASRNEETATSLRAIISSKNRDIAVLERQLAETARRLALATACKKVEEPALPCESASSEPEDEESRLEALENFVSVVRSLSSLTSRDEATHMLMMSQGTCFHCGRKLSEMGSNPDDCGCSYCSILRNILKDTPVEVKKSTVDVSVLLLFVFIVLSIALAIFVYNWRDEAFYVLSDVKERIKLIF